MIKGKLEYRMQVHFVDIDVGISCDRGICVDNVTLALVSRPDLREAGVRLWV